LNTIENIKLNNLTLLILLIYGLAACDSISEKTYDNSIEENISDHFPTHKALLASRINSLDSLKKIISIEYFPKDASNETPNIHVKLTYTSGGEDITAVLEEGINQSEIVNARDGSLLDKMFLLLNSPYSIKHRDDFKKIYILARRRRHLYGDLDKAFYDIALASVKKINTINKAYLTIRDSSERGYVNTFNHVTSQAIITSIFGQEKAAFIADVHERYNMPQLISRHQIDSLLAEGHEKGIIDNYVDIVNNKIGQQLGIYLAKKYNIHRNTNWSHQLLAEYLNDINHYYRLKFGIGMNSFSKNEELIALFSKKINNTIN